MNHGDVRYFEEVEVGQKVGPLERTATAEAVARFCETWGFPRPNQFVDPEVAHGKNLPGPVVPGIMCMAYVTQLMEKWSVHVTVRQVEAIFRRLITHNLPLRIAGVVTDKRVVDGENQVECDVSIQSPDGEPFIQGRAVVTLPGRG